MAISDAVGLDRVSTVLGYKLRKGDFATTSPNLPQRILVLGVPNEANKSGVTYDEVEQHLTTKSVGQKYGYGSPMHSVMRVLKPLSGDGVGGIPILFAAQEPVGSEAEIEVAVSGTATAAGSATIMIGGRKVLDGKTYTFTYDDADTPAQVVVNMAAAINNVVGSPLEATANGATLELKAKFKGLNSNLDVQVVPDSALNGLSYVVAATTAGAGVPTVTDSLLSVGDEWVTLVINTYSPESTAVLNELQAFNGAPSDIPTGNFSGINWRPFTAITGVCTSDEKTAVVTYARNNQTQVTNAFAPAFGSGGMCYEAAANYALIQAIFAQNTPHLDTINQYLIDMPNPIDLTLAKTSYDERDNLVKGGVSTVLWTNKGWQIKDFVTTYHDDEDTSPVFMYVRDLHLDFNVKYAYYLKQAKFALGKVIVPDNDVPPSRIQGDSIQPKTWKAIVMDLIDEFASRGLLVDAEFSKKSIEVEINATNPNRLDTKFDYKRSGIVRIGSTNTFVGAYFGE